MKPEDKIEAWDLVERLRAAEGHSVTLICDNPEFNGQPNNAIECCGDWTKWREKRFTGDTILEALRSAREEMEKCEQTKLYARTD